MSGTRDDACELEQAKESESGEDRAAHGRGLAPGQGLDVAEESLDDVRLRSNECEHLSTELRIHFHERETKRNAFTSAGFLLRKAALILAN